MNDETSMTKRTQSSVGGSIQIKGIDDVARLAEMMSSSGFFNDAKTAAKAGVKIMAGLELDIGPMAAMRGIHVLKGKTTLSGPLLAALIKRHPTYDYRPRKCTDDSACIAFFEDGDEVGEASFSMQDAKKAGLTSNPVWKSYPSDMLFWRALTRGQRRYCPDVGMGAIYNAEELGAEVDADGNVVDAEWVEADEKEKPKQTQASRDDAPASPDTVDWQCDAIDGTWDVTAKGAGVLDNIHERLSAKSGQGLDEALASAAEVIEAWPESAAKSAAQELHEYHSTRMDEDVADAREDEPVYEDGSFEDEEMPF